MTKLERKETVSDDDLMFRIARGDDGALSTLYFRHAGEVKVFVRHLGPELPEARIEEIVLDVFLLVHKKAAQYEPRSKFKAWVFSLAALHTKNARRRSWLRKKLLLRRESEIGHLTMSTNPSDQERGLAAREGLWKVLDSVPDKYRNVILLHAQGFKAHEIAEILNIREGTVWVRIHRGRKLIRSSVGTLEELLCETG